MCLLFIKHISQLDEGNSQTSLNMILTNFTNKIYLSIYDFLSFYKISRSVRMLEVKCCLTNKMSQWVKVLAVKPGKPSLTPGTHTVEGEN